MSRNANWRESVFGRPRVGDIDTARRNRRVEASACLAADRQVVVRLVANLSNSTKAGMTWSSSTSYVALCERMLSRMSLSVSLLPSFFLNCLAALSPAAPACSSRS